MKQYQEIALFVILGLGFGGMINAHQEKNWQNKQDKALQAQTEQIELLREQNEVLNKKLDQTGKTQVEQGKLLDTLHAELHAILNRCAPPTITDAEADPGPIE